MLTGNHGKGLISDSSGTGRYASLNDPMHFVLYEAYATAEAAHKQTAHYQAWRETVAPMMAQAREGKPFRGLFPAG